MLYAVNMVRLKTLGDLRLIPNTFQRPKPLLLLVYLALEGAKDRRHIAELFWSDAANPASSLRVALTQLRQGVENAVLEDGQKLGFGLTSDVQELLESIRNRDFQNVSTLYSGAFLEGFVLPDWSSELEEWVYATRESIAAQVRGALLREAEKIATTGDFESATARAEAAYKVQGAKVAETEELERLYAILMAGDSILATEVRAEAKEFSLELKLTQSEARARFMVKNANNFVIRPLPSAKTSFVGRDPELIELANLLGGTDVRLVTILGAGGVGKTRLALQLAHDQLTENQFENGVYFVPLETLTSSTQIPRAILDALGVSVSGNANPLELLQTSISQHRMLLILDNFEHLTDGALLISKLLERCPNLVMLVTSRERLNIEEEFVLPLLGLRVSSDQVNLADAEASDAVRLFVQRAKRARIDFDLTKADLPNVLEICRLVDGMPLGIELAAAWVKVMPVAQLAKELTQNFDLLETNSRNITERHRSLKAVFEYSWNLLSVKEQLFLARLAVFQGGFDHKAASAVTGVTIAVLASLVDKSLLRVNAEGRYDRHALLYQYAHQKLEETDVEFQNMRQEHAAYFLAWLEDAIAQSREADQQRWFARIETDIPNLRIAFQHFETQLDTKSMLLFCIALVTFWLARGYYGEGRLWFQQALAMTDASQIEPEFRVSLGNLAMIERFRGEFETSKRLYKRSLKLSRDNADVPRVINALNNLALVYRAQGELRIALTYAKEAILLARKIEKPDLFANSLERLGLLHLDLGEYTAARSNFDECLNLRRPIGVKRDIANVLNALGETASCQQDFEAANAFFFEARALFTEIGDKPNLAYVLHNLGDLHQRRSEYETAKVSYQESLAVLMTTKDRFAISFSLQGLAASAAVLSDPKLGACLWGAAQVLRESTGVKMPFNLQVDYEKHIKLAQSQLEPEVFQAAWDKGRNMTLEVVVALALGETPTIGELEHSAFRSLDVA